METWIVALLVLVAVLFVGQIVYQETFKDISDNSGSFIRLSLADLMSLIGTQSSTKKTDTSANQPIIIQPPSFDAQFSSLKDAILSDVKQTVQDEIVSGSLRGLAAGSVGGGDVCADVVDDSCIESMSNLQGSEFMKYIPGKNPADYIRKDSVPCYGCSLPT